mmetsp:Transcript_53542/g.150432  ORF Transcript_53542/g.150432 Transcript_53542/m.150432 type:complete len:413 (+) Transcript_53542:906-2144(+)
MSVNISSTHTPKTSAALMPFFRLSSIAPSCATCSPMSPVKAPPSCFTALAVSAVGELRSRSVTKLVVRTSSDLFPCSVTVVTWTRFSSALLLALPFRLRFPPRAGLVAGPSDQETSDSRALAFLKCRASSARRATLGSLVKNGTAAGASAPASTPTAGSRTSACSPHASSSSVNCDKRSCKRSSPPNALTKRAASSLEYSRRATSPAAFAHNSGSPSSAGSRAASASGTVSPSAPSTASRGSSASPSLSMSSSPSSSASGCSLKAARLSSSSSPLSSPALLRALKVRLSRSPSSSSSFSSPTSPRCLSPKASKSGMRFRAICGWTSMRLAFSADRCRPRGDGENGRCLIAADGPNTWRRSKSGTIGRLREAIDVTTLLCEGGRLRSPESRHQGNITTHMTRGGAWGRRGTAA